MNLKNGHVNMKRVLLLMINLMLIAAAITITIRVIPSIVKNVTTKRRYY